MEFEEEFRLKVTVQRDDTNKILYCQPCELVLAELSGKSPIEVRLAETSQERHLEQPRQDGKEHVVMTINLKDGFARQGLWTNGEKIVSYPELFLVPCTPIKE